MREGQWIRTEGLELTGKTIGLIGFGGIAAEVARIAGGSGMRVLAWNRTPRTAAGVTFAELDTVLAESDVVSVHLLLNDETRNFLNAERIAKISPGALLVNTARAAIVDETAMIEALQSGRLRHAALDVFHTEPLPPGHPLTQLENVTLSAHSAFRTPEASDKLLRMALDIARGLEQVGVQALSWHLERSDSAIRARTARTHGSLLPSRGCPGLCCPSRPFPGSTFDHVRRGTTLDKAADTNRPPSKHNQPVRRG